MTGPQFTSVPTGEAVVVKATPNGPTITRQSYNDGDLYEVRVSRGATQQETNEALAWMPHWELVSVHCPWDIAERDPHLYISVWVSEAA